jgi:hypothetical protein
MINLKFMRKKYYLINLFPFSSFTILIVFKILIFISKDFIYFSIIGYEKEDRKSSNTTSEIDKVVVSLISHNKKV